MGHGGGPAAPARNTLRSMVALSVLTNFHVTAQYDGAIRHHRPALLYAAARDNRSEVLLLVTQKGDGHQKRDPRSIDL